MYHEQKYTVSQHLKIGRYGHAIVCKLQYYASAYTGACLKFVTWIDTSLRLMDCSIFPLLLLSSSLDSLGHSVPPVQYIYVRVGGCPAVLLSWLSGRALVAQTRGVLGPTTGGCQPFHFPLCSPHNMQIFASYSAMPGPILFVGIIAFPLVYF